MNNIETQIIAQKAVTSFIVKNLSPEAAIHLIKACALLEAANIHFVDYSNSINKMEITHDDILNYFPILPKSSKRDMAVAAAKRQVEKINNEHKRLSDTITKFVANTYGMEGRNREVLDAMVNEVLKTTLVKHDEKV